MTTNDPVVSALERLLADSYTLYLKTHNYHWNVTGPMFNTLHTLFEVEYNDLALAVDEIAERLATLGERPNSTYAQSIELARLQEDDSDPGAETMLKNVLSDLEHIHSSLRATAKEAESRNDVATFNLLDGRADAAEKQAWMIRASLA